MNTPNTASNTSASSTQRPIQRLDDAGLQPTDDHLAVEEPLEIRIGDEPIAVTMRTPGHDEDLAAGFCLTEGIIEEPDELESVSPCDLAEFGNVINVMLTASAMTRRAEQVCNAKREMYLSSSCGLCGKQSIEHIEQKVTPITQRMSVDSQVLLSLPQSMRVAQATFDETGGLHAAALFDLSGRLLILREDVGRHNAVDKVLGHALLTGMLPASQTILLVSGRASFEIMQKAAMAHVPIVAAVSAPSSLAVDFAKRLNMTLVGFLRKQRMNVYHDWGRVVVSEACFDSSGPTDPSEPGRHRPGRAEGPS